MPRSLYERGLLKPADVARLQRVFDTACRKRHLRPDSEEARELALTVLALHNAGLADEDMLVDAVSIDRAALL